MEFRDFLIKEYGLRESSAKDYVGRLNGIINKGIYKGEDEVTSVLKNVIEREFPKSKNHYLLTLERYITFQKSRLKSQGHI
ncbi:hypothetical protein [Priestia koreensis]|uniref:hypothetical protein n=1 Tax=Priestia koreensis TaxID=284581 RepID=UPI003018CE6A